MVTNITGAMFRKMSVGRKEVVLGVWDTAGSERYESMARLYYRSVSSNCTILCHKVRVIKHIMIHDQHNF